MQWPFIFAFWPHIPYSPTSNSLNLKSSPGDGILLILHPFPLVWKHCRRGKGREEVSGGSDIIVLSNGHPEWRNSKLIPSGVPNDVYMKRHACQVSHMETLLLVVLPLALTYLCNHHV